MKILPFVFMLLPILSFGQLSNETGSLYEMKIWKNSELVLDTLTTSDINLDVECEDKVELQYKLIRLGTGDRTRRNLPIPKEGSTIWIPINICINNIKLEYSL